MMHAMALVTFSLNKIVGSLLHSSVTDGINHAAQNTWIQLIIFLSYHFLTYDTKRKSSDYKSPETCL